MASKLPSKKTIALILGTLILGLFFSIVFFPHLSILAIAANDSSLATQKTINQGFSSSESNYSFCDQSGYYHELFNYSGKDAECLCKTYKDNGECKTYLSENEKKICRLNNPFWAPGSLKTAGNTAQDGSLVNLKGLDSSGFHWLMTGLNDSLSNAIGFLKKSPDIFFGRDVFVERDLYLQNKKDNICFGEIKGGNCITKNGDDGLDFTFSANTGAERKPLRLIKTDAANNRIQIDTGLTVSDHLKAETADFQGNHLNYCSPTDGKCPSQGISRGHSDNFIYR